MFIDKAKICVKAGDGGKGVNSFYTDKFTRPGHPDGGDGGKGGDIIFKADSNIHTLLDFKYTQHFKAASGKHGSGKKKKGKDGQVLIIKVPLGTLIYDNKTKFLLRDLSGLGEEVIIVKGGLGGKGNKSHKDATPGKPGEEKELFLELKLIADAGVIGYPNVGKSSLISCVSGARPKIASYPFTTKEPVLGIIYFNDDSFAMADIPGLIEGAHAGRGLGTEFLRHVERTHVLVHMLDMAASEGRDPIKDYYTLNKEIELYSLKVRNKLQVIAANKMDLPGAKENLKRFKEEIKEDVFPISCKRKTGLNDLIEAIYKKVKSAK